MTNRRDRANIDLRLATVDSIVAQMDTVEKVRERLIALAGLQGTVIDLENLAHHTERIVEMISQRLSTSEELLNRVLLQTAAQSAHE
ncbi:hypothetical protein BH10ACT2_BH10ACT2_00280 [soil metagenome]